MPQHDGAKTSGAPRTDRGARARPHGFRRLLGLVTLSLAARAGSAQVRQSQPEAPVIRVETNLVVVRVVVRDSKGRPVGGLRREDFHLFDEGKPRQIVGFSVETSPPRPTERSPTQLATAPAHAAIAPPVQAPSAVPERFVALFFDDLHMEFGDVAHTRDAGWKYISNVLRPEERIGIFTSSNQSHIDFTADRAKLHDLLFRIAPHGRNNPTEHQCPVIGVYQAYLMAEREQADAFEIAEREGDKCDCDDPPMGANYSLNMARGVCEQAVFATAQGLARQIWDLADRQSQDALDVMQGVINLLASRPGQRTLVLISTGFLAETRQTSINLLIDRALRRKVVVNALDAAGLYTKTYNDPILSDRPDLQARKFRIENEGITIQRDVLASITEGTGGKFFHNNNDFEDGFRQTAQMSEVAYVISFSTADMKLDGRFHKLKIKVDHPTLLNVQARRGYFASPSIENKTPIRTDIEALVYSQEDLQGLRAAITAQNDKGRVVVQIHVDISDLQFRKENGNNINTLTFDTAVFDQDGKYVLGKESSLDFKLPDAKLESLRQAGVNALTNLQLPSGVYRIREVVRDTETKKIAALNYNLEVTAPPAGNPGLSHPP